MDEAVRQALSSLKEDMSSMRSDFSAHVKEDTAALASIGKQIAEWSGQLSTIKWLSGAILTAMLAYGVKHW